MANLGYFSLIIFSIILGNVQALSHKPLPENLCGISISLCVLYEMTFYLNKINDLMAKIADDNQRMMTFVPPFR